MNIRFCFYSLMVLCLMAIICEAQTVRKKVRKIKVRSTTTTNPPNNQQETERVRKVIRRRRTTITSLVPQIPITTPSPNALQTTFPTKTGTTLIPITLTALNTSTPKKSVCEDVHKACTGFKPRDCYFEEMEIHCCVTCKRYLRHDLDHVCRYGDREDWCESRINFMRGCKVHDEQYMLKNCCESCPVYRVPK